MSTVDEFGRMRGLVGKLKVLSLTPQMKAELEAAKKPSFWSILEYGKNSYETRYNRMLCWLLNPAGTHGLGGFALRWFAGYAERKLNVCNQNSCTGKAKEAYPVKEETKYATPSREEAQDPTPGIPSPWGNYKPDDRDGAKPEALGKNIDVLAYSFNDEICVTVENKMNSDEHSSKTEDGEVSQLKKYYDAVMSDDTFGSFKYKYFIFLTKDGHTPPSFSDTTCDDNTKEDWQRRWMCMSYADLVEMLDAVLPRLTTLEGVAIVKDFRNDVVRNIDMGNVGLYNSFYDYRPEVIALYDYFFGGDTEDENTEVNNNRRKAVKSVLDPSQAGIQFLAALRDMLSLEDAKYLIQQVYEHLSNSNRDVQLIIRRLFNHYAVKQINLADKDAFGTEKVADRVSKVKPKFKDEWSQVRISGNYDTHKGQGINMTKAGTGSVLYFSGDERGTMPNDCPAVRGSGRRAPKKYNAAEMVSWDDERLVSYFEKFLKFEEEMRALREESKKK